MKRIFPSISWYGWSLLAILLLSALLLVSLVLVGTDDSSQVTGDSNQPNAEAAAFQGGRTAWLDPNTGELSKAKPPAGIVIPLDDQAMRRFSTSEVDLIPETLPDGTVILDLQGRFRQGSVATVDDAGEVKIHRIGGEMFMSEDGRDIQRHLHENESNTSSDDNQP